MQERRDFAGYDRFAAPVIAVCRSKGRHDRHLRQVGESGCGRLLAAKAAGTVSSAGRCRARGGWRIAGRRRTEFQEHVVMAKLLPVKGSSRMPGFRGNLAGNSAAGRNGMSARGMQVSSDSVSVTDTSLEAALTRSCRRWIPGATTHDPVLAKDPASVALIRERIDSLNADHEVVLGDPRRRRLLDPRPTRPTGSGSAALRRGRNPSACGRRHGPPGCALGGPTFSALFRQHSTFGRFVPDTRANPAAAPHPKPAP